MEFSDLVKYRKSVRLYSKQEVEDKTLNKVLEAGRLAPSAGNFQPWYFLIVRDQVMKDKIAETYVKWNDSHYKTVPVFIVILGNHNKSWKRKSDNKDFCEVDVAIAADHMTLQAAELGLGTCWVCGYDAAMLQKVLELPDYIEPIAILHCGYPDLKNNIVTKNRKNWDEVVHREKFDLTKVID